MFDSKSVFGDLLDSLGDGESVHRFQRDSPENQHVERSLEEFGLRLGHVV